MELICKCEQEGASWKEARFVIDNLRVNTETVYGNVKADSITLYFDGKKYQNTCESWSGFSYNAADLLEFLINSYLREEKGIVFDKTWDTVFADLNKFKEKKDGLITKLPAIDVNERVVYDLIYATSRNLFYDCGMVLMLNRDGEILTEMDNYFDQELKKEICGVLKGEVTCIYCSDRIEKFIAKEGGKEGFLDKHDYYKDL